MSDNRNILDDFKVNHNEKTIDTSVKLKVGIIGCGWIAEAHVREYLKMPDVEIVAFADLIPGKAAEFFERHGVKGVKTDYADHKEMLDDESLELESAVGKPANELPTATAALTVTGAIAATDTVVTIGRVTVTITDAPAQQG